jgi:sterol desaturase/sphingolipid hydroxylase (fatty acid hydroxylase superfamily)
MMCVPDSEEKTMLNFTFLESLFSLPIILSEASATSVLLVCFALFACLELVAPRETPPKQSVCQSYQANISLFVFNSVVMSLLSISSLFLLAQHYAQYGLLRYLSNPAVEAVLSFILLDLLLYLWHKTCHRFDSLWLFHRVHHNDPCINTSTAFRLHTVELFTTHLLKSVSIILLGIDQIVVLINEMITALFILFHHSNISFKGEKWLGRVIIVPYLHRTHHSVERCEHDSNYGAVLSIWDQLFGTLSVAEPKAIGIKGDSPLDFVNLLRFGFDLYSPPKTQSLPVALDVMIAEAAYYKAEKRDFYPGNELLDWLEAKREIIALVYGDKSVNNQARNKQAFNRLSSQN